MSTTSRKPINSAELTDEAYAKLRDQFACAALTGLVGKRKTPVDEMDIVRICIRSYAWADVMLTARNLGEI